MSDDLKNGLVAQAVAHISLFVALMIPPSTLSHKRLAMAFLPVILACDVYSWKMQLGFLGVVQGLWATELLLFRNPREHFKLLHFQTPEPKPKDTVSTKKDGAAKLNAQSNDKEDSRKKGNDGLPWAQPFPSSLYQRIWWVIKLTQSIRYTGWLTTPSAPLPEAQSLPTTKKRLTWLLNRTFLIAFCLLLQDATNLYMKYDPYFQIQTSIDEAFPRRLGTFLATYHLNFLPPRAVRMLVLGSQQYAMFSLVGDIPAVFMVLLGWTGLVSEFYGRMENYLPVMGNPLVVLRSGLRGFWGRFWHQILREMFLGPGRAVSKLLRIPDKSIYGYALQIWVAFGISGIVHAFSLPQGIRGVSPLQYAKFFWLHVYFVLFEIAVCHIFRARMASAEKNTWGKVALAVVRLVWVLSVLYLTVPTVLDQLVRVMRVIASRPVLFLPWSK